MVRLREEDVKERRRSAEKGSDPSYPYKKKTKNLRDRFSRGPMHGVRGKENRNLGPRRKDRPKNIVNSLKEKRTSREAIKREQNLQQDTGHLIGVNK